MKKNKVILILFVILIIPIAIVLHNVFFGGYYFETEEDCIRHYVNKNVESSDVIF